MTARVRVMSLGDCARRRILASFAESSGRIAPALIPASMTSALPPASTSSVVRQCGKSARCCSFDSAGCSATRISVQACRMLNLIRPDSNIAVHRPWPRAVLASISCLPASRIQARPSPTASLTLLANSSASGSGAGTGGGLGGRTRGRLLSTTTAVATAGLGAGAGEVALWFWTGGEECVVLMLELTRFDGHLGGGALNRKHP